MFGKRKQMLTSQKPFMDLLNNINSNYIKIKNNITKEE